MKSEKEKRGILLMLTIFSLLNICRLAKRQYKKSQVIDHNGHTFNKRWQFFRISSTYLCYVQG